MAHINLLRYSIIQLFGARILTRFPSTTPFGLALGPDLPWGDERRPGNLGQSVDGILTHLALLTPAFSLLSSPAVLTVNLRRT